MKTIITSNDQRDTILRKLAKDNNGIVKDTQVLPFNVALKEESDDDVLLSLRLASKLKEKEKDFPIYRDMFKYPSFINEIISFSKECILYNITVDDLPTGNPNEEELKRILDISLSLDYVEKRNINNKDTVINELLEDKDTSLSYQFINDTYHYEIYEKLKEKLPFNPYPSNNPTLHLKYALNARCEAESIVQDICKSNKSSNIILTNPSSQLPLYEAVLSRYNIPFSSLKESYSLKTPLIFKALVLFALKKDKDSLLECIALNAFTKKASGRVLDFFEETLTSTNMPEDISNLSNSDIFENEIRNHIEEYKEAKEYYDSVLDEINELLNTKTYKEMFYKAFGILKNNSILSVKEEFSMASKIRSTLIEAQDYIQVDEDLIFLARAIENYKASYQILESDFVVISDIRHPIEPKENAYIVSVNGSNYPGVISKQGLFDERYVESIDKYPSKQDRYDMYMKQLDWLNNSASKNLYYSYYTNDYKGKEIKLSFEIENKFKGIEASKWDLVSLTPKKVNGHKLSEDNAKDLFLKDGKVEGSISTIERYFMCQYSYFIGSGLKVRKNQRPTLQANTIGTIQHKLLEDSFNDNKEKYASLSKEEIEKYIEPSFEVLYKLHPNSKEFISITKQRMIDGIYVSLKFLEDFEDNTSFKEAHSEYSFKDKDITDHVRLRGVIDRIDVYRDELLRIVDYKSSGKQLNEAKIKAGEQLQLITYLIIASEIKKLNSAGAYYFSLKQENVNVIAKKREKENKQYYISSTFFDEASSKERAFNKRRLSGWTFIEDTEDLDKSGSHIISLGSQMDYEKVKKCILEVYELLYNELTSGSILVNPIGSSDIDSACTYCDYKSICRHKGELNKITPLVMADDSFKVEKEK